jgi:amidophosphoribosyltransferase
MMGYDRHGDDRDDRPREACGVVGIHLTPGGSVEASRLCFFALYALQHRGQESAGIASCDGVYLRQHKAMGLVAQVFDERAMKDLVGHMAIGHNRYSTTGSSLLANAQPYVIETMGGPLAVGHNGNLTNTAGLRRALLERGVGLSGSSDSEVITQLLAAPPPGVNEGAGPDWVARIKALMAVAEGAYSLVVQTRAGVYGVRDALGLRPLCLGVIVDESRDEGGHVVASESCALGTVGARYVREIEPGEIVHIGPHGVTSHRGAVSPRRALCVFEYVYFARPDSMLDDQSVHRVRQAMGERLAREAPADADVVIGVPDSAVPAAIGYAAALSLPYSEGLIKNRYIGRTFIEPSASLRRSHVKLKYNALRANLEGRRVVLIDDSIVRGNTAGPLVKLLRDDGGAAEVHVRVSSPPVRHPCFMGVDMATHAELVAHREDIEGIRRIIGADSLAYLSYEGMLAVVAAGPKAAERPAGHCGACFTGEYPAEIATSLRRSAAAAVPTRGAQ